MSSINTKVVSHRLVIHPFTKPAAQRKRKVGKEMRITIDEEVEKLFNIGSIIETKYPTWLTNMVLVRKANKNDTCV